MATETVRVYLPDERCTGFDMPLHLGGRKYNAAPGSGYVEMLPEDAAYVKAHTKLAVGRRWYGAIAPSIRCAVCAFEAYVALAGAKCIQCGTPWADAEIIRPQGYYTHSDRVVVEYASA